MEGIVVGSLVEDLISLLKREFSLMAGVEKDVEKLVGILSAIEAVLEDAEEKQMTNKEIADWLKVLKNATYDAADDLEALTSNFASTSSSNQVSHLFSPDLNIKNTTFRRKLAKKLKEITIKFDEIAIQISLFHLNTDDMSEAESEYTKERETTWVLNDCHIYGRDENKMKIIDILVNDFVNQEHVSILPIVGMGGIGKTMLAQSIFNDKRVERHFELKIWVCVSEPFDIKRVLNSIIEYFDKEVRGLVAVECDNRRFDDILRGNRFLIVMDDVWNENLDEWNKLKSFFKGGTKGSSVVLTTRSEKVASITGTVPEHRLAALSDGDCFSLFKNRALGERGEDEHPTLIAIGKEIAQKCKGNPLVGKSLASMLRFKTNKKLWELVRDNETWNLSQGGETTIIAALRLSYNNLPSHLKQCFAYCSIFPKDFVMEKNKLIYLWIANGFIHSQGNMEMEEVGNDVFNDLMTLSFFQDAREDDYGNIVTCKMHDLMHDLACFVARNESLIARVSERNPVPETIRNLTVLFDPVESQTELDYLFSSRPSLRTLLFGQSIDFSRFLFPPTLRVLDLGSTKIQNLSPSVCDLIHLRYLDISHNLLTSLPESFHRLRNLQMLDLKHNPRFTTLPLSMCKLEHLRDLNLSYCRRITSLPQSIHGLKNLRSLNVSGNGRITELPLSICKLEHLRYLVLFSCTNITSLPDSISRIQSLQFLILRNCKNLEVFPENMRNMSSLRLLDIRMCYKSSKLPIRIGQVKVLQTLNRFFVGRPLVGNNGEGAADICKLKGQNQLEGGLEICGLENVRNGTNAKQANLSSKLLVSSLALNWGSDDDSLQVNNSKEVLVGLQLPPNINELGIWNYKWEASFPEGFLPNLLPLVSVEIHGCSKLTSLPRELENLNFLRWLKISTCRELVSLQDGLLQKLTSLEFLAIDWCRSLKSLGVVGIQRVLNPSTSCSSYHFQSPLQVLQIFRCSELVLSEEDFQHLNALRLLRLHDLYDLPRGIQCLPMLRHLDIGYCWNLRMLPEWIKNLTVLHTFEITYCHKELCKRCEKEKGEDWHLISHIPDFNMLSY